jgi:hypothetical protein
MRHRHVVAVDGIVRWTRRHRRIWATIGWWFGRFGQQSLSASTGSPPPSPRGTRRRCRPGSAGSRCVSAAVALSRRLSALRRACAAGLAWRLGDRHRLHLPGGDAGLVGLRRGRPSVALSGRLSRLALGAAGRSAAFASPGSSPNGCARACSPVNSVFALGPGADRRPLRQGASRALRRISADAAACCRRSACRGSRPATSTSPGPGPRTIDLPGWGKVGFQLCYEIIFSGEVVDRATARTSSSTRRTTPGSALGPAAASRPGAAARAEEGLPVIRSTPTGISAVIDARGGCRSAAVAHRRRDRRRAAAARRRRPCSPASATSSRCCSASCCSSRRLRSGRAALGAHIRIPYILTSRQIFLEGPIARPCAAPISSRPNRFPKAIPTRSPTRFQRRDRRPVPVQGPRGARRLRDAGHHQRIVLAGEIRCKGHGDRHDGWAPGVRDEIEQASAVVKRIGYEQDGFHWQTAELREPPARPVGAHRPGRRRQRATRTRAPATRASCSASPATRPPT